jgi:hypothetical protein
MIHQCPKCELRFERPTELDYHCRNDHPDFRHEYPATKATVPPAPLLLRLLLRLPSRLTSRGPASGSSGFAVGEQTPTPRVAFGQRGRLPGAGRWAGRTPPGNWLTCSDTL